MIWIIKADVAGDRTGALTRLLHLLAPYRGRVALALGLTALTCLLNLSVPLLIQGLVDGVATPGRLTTSMALALGLLGVFAAQAGVGLAVAYVTGPVGLGVVRDLRHRLYARLQRVELAFYDRTPTGVILSRLVDDVEVVQGLITGQSLTVLADLGTTLAVSGLLLARDARLALVVLAFLPLHAATFRRYSRKIRAESEEVRRRLDAVFGRLKETLDGALAVKACAAEEGEVAGFAARLGESHGPRLRVGRLSAAFSSLSGAVGGPPAASSRLRGAGGGVGTSVVFAAGALAVGQGRLTPGEVVSTTALAAVLFGPVARLADLNSLFQQAGASLDRLGEILDREPGVTDPERPVTIGRARGRVEFDRVGFGYRPGHPVLWDVRIKAEPGMKVALVGPTGCGKSTLMNLLMRFYDPTCGEIRLDGVPVRTLAAADLRRQIGVVPQEPVVFRGTLADNIRYGTPGADDARVEAAARAALVHSFALGLPDGYATVVGEGAAALSQGERQRLAVARAFCKDPALVVLDEATGSLDAASEALVQAALANLLRGRTAFVVAHRLATVADADLIVVMDGGLVVQAGTHAGLLRQRDGLYRRLCLGQLGAAGRAVPGPRAAPASARARPFEPPSRERIPA